MGSALSEQKNGNGSELFCRPLFFLRPPTEVSHIRTPLAMTKPLYRGSCSLIPGRGCFGDLPGDEIVVPPPSPIVEPLNTVVGFFMLAAGENS